MVPRVKRFTEDPSFNREKSKLYLTYGERQANCQTARITLEPFDHEK